MSIWNNSEAQSYYGLKVADNEMAKFNILADDIVVVDPNAVIKSGKIVVVRFPTDTIPILRKLTIERKRYIFEAGGAPEVFDLDNETMPYICGKVITIYRDI